MLQETKKMMEDIIQKDLEDLKELSAGSQERNKAITDIVSLCDRLNDANRLDADIEKTNSEIQLKECEHEEENNQKVKDRIAKIGLGVASILVPTIAGVAVNRWVMRYEETGSISPKSKKILDDNIRRSEQGSARIFKF